jgi:integrase
VFSIAIAGALPERRDNASADEWAVVQRHALPAGFKYLIADDQQIVEPVLLYLHDKCIRNARIRSVGNTQAALCADLYEWFSYLEVAGVRWDCVGSAEVQRYRDGLLGNCSPRTGRHYAIATVRRRLTTILDFHRWASRQGFTESGIDDARIAVGRRRRADDAMAHIHGGAQRVTARHLLPADTGGDQVDAFAMVDLQRVLAALGPAAVDAGPRRDRVVATLAVSTGMRLDECVGLTISQFLSLRQDPTYGNYALPLTRTKGLRPRTVVVPAAVHDEVSAYVATERAAAVRKGGGVEGALFVNGETASRNPGKKVSTHTVWRGFHAAVIEAGLCRVEHDSSGATRTIALHSFHDLRHTFAMVMYFELAKAGRGEPWLALKNLLGHRNLKTTIDTYLKSVQAREAVTTDALGAYLRGLRND